MFNRIIIVASFFLGIILIFSIGFNSCSYILFGKSPEKGLIWDIKDFLAGFFIIFSAIFFLYTSKGKVKEELESILKMVLPKFLYLDIFESKKRFDNSIIIAKRSSEYINADIDALVSEKKHIKAMNELKEKENEVLIDKIKKEINANIADLKDLAELNKIKAETSKLLAEAGQEKEQWRLDRHNVESQIREDAKRK